MKTKQLILSTLAAALAGQVVIIAQNPPPPPSAPPPVPDAGQIAAEAVAAANDIVRTQLDQVNVEVQKQLAQAQQAVQLAQSTGVAGVGGGGFGVAEIPEPPEPPEPPEDVFGAGAGMGGGIGGFGGGVGGEMGGMVGALTGFGSKATASPLVIFADKPEDTRLADTQEDLNIMSRILEQTALRNRERSDPMAMGITVSTFAVPSHPQALYLEGYGAVFMLNVPFPLAAPPEKAVKKADKPADSTWERTKQELYGPPDGASAAKPMMDLRMMMRYGLMPKGFKVHGPIDGAQYDPAKVEDLKRGLLDALKNASNLRHVGADEQIVVAVSSSGSASSMQLRTVKLEQNGRSSGTAVSKTESGKGAPGSTLVIRVKKGDADDFAAGKLDAAGFTERAKIAIY